MKSQFSPIPSFLIGLFFVFCFLFVCLFVFVVTFLSSVYILDISPLSDVGLVKIFFPICRLLIFLIDYVVCLKEAL